jgi:hypothetical protein
MEQTSTPSSLTYDVDPEHSGIRFAVVAAFALIWIVAYFLVQLVTNPVGFDIIAVVVGFIVTMLLTQQVEKLLKQRWPSGRKLEIAPHYIRLSKKQKVEDEIDPRLAVNVLLWHFKINKRARVRKGWLVVACALEQDQSYVAAYTFMSPEDFDTLRDKNQFAALRKADKDANQPGSMQLVGMQRRLHEAEKYRWFSGAEMTQDEFRQYLTSLQDSFPQWMPSVV